MRISRPVKIILTTLAIVFVLVFLFVVLSVSSINREIDFDALGRTMDERIDSVDVPLAESEMGFAVGFSKVNLTPPSAVSTAGYGKRLGKLYRSVHDSIYVRTIVVDDGRQRVAIVSADLLIIPPTVTALLKQQLPEVGFTLDNTYLGATHSHNSIGNWATGLTSLMYGTYEDSIVQFIADRIKVSVLQASANMVSAIAKIDSVAFPEGVYNRVIDDGPVDPLIRMIEIERSDSIKLLFISYTAHATCLFSKDLELSGDYPGKLLQILETGKYDFAMFMAGAVGSHGPAAPDGGWSCVNWMAERVAAHVSLARFTPMKHRYLEMHRVPLQLPEIQPKVWKSLRVNPGLFRTVFGEYPTFINVFRFGDVVFLGTPCDFSGEFNFALDSLAASRNVLSMVTSFNGGYIGYLTPQEYYDIDHYETQLMNWYGPGNGEYVKEVLEKALVSVTQ